MESGPRVRRRVLIRGRVQGVFFRQSTRERARELGVLGWVRNTTDGRVEAVLEGEESAVDEMVRWCHNGPPAATVTAVEVRQEASEDALSGFAIRPTEWR